MRKKNTFDAHYVTSICSLDTKLTPLPKFKDKRLIIERS